MSGFKDTKCNTRSLMMTDEYWLLLTCLTSLVCFVVSLYFANLCYCTLLILFDFVSASYFNPIIEFLIKNFGYVRGQNLRGAPYDFRKAPSELSIVC